MTPEHQARIRDSFARQGLMGLLGASIADLAPGLCVLRLPFRKELTQQMGFFHAGGTSALADTAGGYAAMTLYPPDREVLTTEFKLNLLNPAKGDWLEAQGRVIKSGRTLSVCQLDVHACTPDGRVHVAVGLQTLISVAAIGA